MRLCVSTREASFAEGRPIGRSEATRPQAGGRQGGRPEAGGSKNKKEKKKEFNAFGQNSLRKRLRLVVTHYWHKKAIGQEGFVFSHVFGQEVFVLAIVFGQEVFV